MVHLYAFQKFVQSSTAVLLKKQMKLQTSSSKVPRWHSQHLVIRGAAYFGSAPSALFSLSLSLSSALRITDDSSRSGWHPHDASIRAIYILPLIPKRVWYKPGYQHSRRLLRLDVRINYCTTVYLSITTTNINTSHGITHPPGTKGKLAQNGFDK